MLVRTETDADRDAIRRIHLAAFDQSAEADLVDALRDEGWSQLSLVAELDGRIVGHILFSRLRIVADRSAVDALSLAPMAVLPENQRQGIGTRLIHGGLERCRDVGHRIVIVVGHPSYYPRFGFSAERAAVLQSAYAGEAFMALELAPGALEGVSGRLEYPAPFAGL